MSASSSTIPAVLLGTSRPDLVGQRAGHVRKKQKNKKRNHIEGGAILENALDVKSHVFCLRWAKTRILKTDTRVSKRKSFKTLACQKNVGGFFKH